MAETVAVIIPAYNGAKFLVQALDSVMAQTHPATEVIVVDDGSTDNSIAVARRYPNVRILQQQHAGVCVARNLGAQEATSTWLAFLDQDDYWMPENIEQQLAALRASPGADMSVSDRMMVWEPEPGQRSQGLRASLPDFSRNQKEIYKGLRFPPSCTLLRRSTFFEVGGFHPDATPCEDWDLWLRLDQAGSRFINCPQPLLIYRFHGGNESSKAWKMFHGEMRVFRKHIAPRYHPFVRGLYWRSARARFELGVCLGERENGNPFLPTLLSSLVRWPFGVSKRYRMLAHTMRNALKGR